MPAQRNTMSYEWNMMSFCSYFLKQLFSHLPLGSLNAFVSWARYREGVQKAKMWALVFWDSREQVFFPMLLLVVFLLQESGPLGQKSMSPWNPVMSSWKTRWANSPSQWWQVSFLRTSGTTGPSWLTQSHTVVCVHGFRVTGNNDCGANSDKIVSQRVSSVVESSMVYACWKKSVQSYATQDLVLHVVLQNYAQGGM